MVQSAGAGSLGMLRGNSCKILPTVPKPEISYENFIPNLDSQCIIYTEPSNTSTTIAINNWVSHSNPSGQIYYVGNRAGSYCRYVTLTDPSKFENESEIKRAIYGIEASESMSYIPELAQLSNFVDIVLERRGDQWFYYMVQHDGCRIRWHREDQRMNRYLSYQYWCFMELFPHLADITEDKLDDMVGILEYNYYRLLRSERSALNISLSECSGMLDLINRLRTHVPHSSGDLRCYDPYIKATLSNIMMLLEHSQFMDNDNKSTLLDGHNFFSELEFCKSWKNFLMGMALVFVYLWMFFAPLRHYRALHEVISGPFLTGHSWISHEETLREEWTDFLLYATLLLGVNISLLGVPSISYDGQQTISGMTITQMLTMLSILTSTSCIIVGLFLLREHHTKNDNNIAEILQQLRGEVGSKEGSSNAKSDAQWQFASLAVLYSLPCASLIYAFFFFILALFILCIESKIPYQVSFAARLAVLVYFFGITLSWAAIAFYLSVRMFFLRVSGSFLSYLNNKLEPNGKNKSYGKKPGHSSSKQVLHNIITFRDRHSALT